jgi:hypothetical protein
VTQLQRSVTKDARKSVDAGVLDGPILNTQCTPLGGGSTDDLTALTGLPQRLSTRGALLWG